jgi:hypothetical protein
MADNRPILVSNGKGIIMLIIKNMQSPDESKRSTKILENHHPGCGDMMKKIRQREEFIRLFDSLFTVT